MCYVSCDPNLDLSLILNQMIENGAEKKLDRQKSNRI